MHVGWWPEDVLIVETNSRVGELAVSRIIRTLPNQLARLPAERHQIEGIMQQVAAQQNKVSNAFKYSIQ